MPRIKPPEPDTPVEAGSINEQLVLLAGQFAAKTVDLRLLKEQEKLLSKEVDQLSKQLVELTDLAELEPPFRVTGMGTISIRTDYSVKQIDKDALKQSLEALGHGELITITVNAQTLGSLIRELAEMNKQFPDGIEVTSYQKAVYTKARAAKQ